MKVSKRVSTLTLFSLPSTSQQALRPLRRLPKCQTWRPNRPRHSKGVTLKTQLYFFGVYICPTKWSVYCVYCVYEGECVESYQLWVSRGEPIAREDYCCDPTWVQDAVKVLLDYLRWSKALRLMHGWKRIFRRCVKFKKSLTIAISKKNFLFGLGHSPALPSYLPCKIAVDQASNMGVSIKMRYPLSWMVFVVENPIYEIL